MKVRRKSCPKDGTVLVASLEYNKVAAGTGTASKCLPGTGEE
jgi:hypothetical protein